MRLSRLGLKRLGMMGGGGVAINKNHPTELTDWYTALEAAGSSRAVVSFIGDSVTEGHASTDFDSTDYVSLVRAALQAKFGNGGEGFISPVHTADPLETGWAASPTDRWTFGAGGAWTLPSADTKEGWGAISGAAYWNNVNSDPTITGTFTTLQVMTGIKFDATVRSLLVDVDAAQAGAIVMGGGAADHSQFAPGTINEYTGFADAAHVVKFDPSLATYVFLEGVRFLRGAAGVVCDRYAKSGMRGSWLGVANDADYTNYNVYYKALYSTVDAIPANLYVVMLGINDFVNSVNVADFQTAMGVIAARCKAHSSTILVVPPKPLAGTDAAYTNYANAIKAAAAANGCLVLDVFERWGSTHNAAFDADDVHPNNAGHADIASFISGNIGLFV